MSSCKIVFSILFGEKLAIKDKVLKLRADDFQAHNKMGDAFPTINHFFVQTF